MTLAAHILLVVITATAFLDLASLARRHWLGTRLPDFGLFGRRLAHLPRGRWFHASIAATPAVPGERWIGWTAHYLIGVAFAAGLVTVVGAGWLREPTPGPALLAGLVTVAFPYLVLQPATGAGFAASRAPNPGVARMQSLLTHALFGLGLYAAAQLVRLVFRVS